MNDKTRDLSQQDSEELLVTSTSSSITVESTVSLSETETTESDTSTATVPTTTGVCQIVTSSTGNSGNFESVSERNDYVASAEHRLAAEGGEGGGERTSAGSSTMGGTSSNNDAETCVLPTSSNYIEQSSETPKTMVITRSGGNSNDFNIRSAEVLVSPTTSSAPTISAPTTRSKRKLMNEAGGTTALSRTNSISLNNKSIKIEIKNHQSPMATRKSSATSINSLPNQSDKATSEGKLVTVGKSSSTTSAKHQNLAKVNLTDDGGSSSSSNATSNKLVIKKNNCINDVGSNDKVEESHSTNDTTTCTATAAAAAAGDNDESDSTRTKAPVVSSCDNDDRISPAGENRKVEPLKINLNRDAVKTKITIKPIVKLASLVMDGDSPGSPIPKLTIKPPSNSNIASTSSDAKSTSNGSDQQLPSEPHIVPKLTIRASDFNSSLTNADVKHSVVPKLTIKMDGGAAINCVKEPLLNSSPSSASPSPPPLPKLTIKTSGDITESIISTHSPKSSTSSQCHIVSTSSASSHSPPLVTTIPKLTIKPIPKPSTSNGSEVTPSHLKVTIKPIPPPMTSESSSCNDSDYPDEAEITPQTTVPKLTIRTGIEPSVKIQHESSNTIPKLTIRTIQDAGGDSTEKTQSIPKFTIKSVQESTQCIPKLTIAMNDSTSSSSCSSPTNEKIPKLTIRQVEQDETDRIPKLMISSVQDKEDGEKVPKLTIKHIPDVEVLDRVPKITIKAFSESEDSERMEKIPKLTIKSVLESGENADKIPKLTIRQVQETEDGEKVPKLKVTSVQEPEKSLSVPKLMIKQIQDDDEKVPKLTIVSKSVCDDTAKVRKLKIKPVQDSSSSSKGSTQTAQECEPLDRVSKLQVKALDPLDGEKIPKLTIRQVPESERDGRIPKITIVQTMSDSQSETDADSDNFRKAKPSKRSCGENCGEEMPACKSLRLSPKNDCGSLPGCSTFRKEKEKEKETEAKNGTTPKSQEAAEERVVPEGEKKENRVLEVIDIDLEPERKVERQKGGEKLSKETRECKEKLGARKEEEELSQEDVLEKGLVVVDTGGLKNDAKSVKGLGLENEVDLEDQMDTEGIDIGMKGEANVGREIKLELLSLDLAVPILETIDLESEPEETINGEQEEEDFNCESQDKEEQKIERADMQEESEDIPEIIELNQDPEIIYVEEDSSEPTSGVCNDRQNISPTCNIPLEHTSQLDDSKLFPISESVDLTTPSPTPASSPVHLLNDDDSNHKFLSDNVAVNDVSSELNAIETIELPSTSVDDLAENCTQQTITPDSGQEDMSEGEKLFEINCAPISTETTQSPKAFSEQIIIENSEDMSMPSEGQLVNSSSPHPSLYREEQSKSTENSSEPAHLDEKFLSNVDVLSCLGICQENANNASFNAVDADDVLRRNNNKESLTVTAPVTTATTTTTTADEENSLESCRTSNTLKRCADSSVLIDVEAPASKKTRCDMEDLVTQNAIPDTLCSESEATTMLLTQSLSLECSETVKELSNMIESETSCDEKFRTLIELKTFEAGIDSTEDAGKTDETSIDLKRIFADDKPENASHSSQDDASVNLSKSLDSKIDIVQETHDSLASIRTRQNILLINEESGSDGMLVDECTSDPLCGFSNPVVDDKKNQEVDSGVDISSSVKSESVPEVPVKRPRGRPRKDGRPAGSVKKPERRMRGDHAGMPVRRKFKGVLLEAQNVTEVVVTPRKRGPRPRLPMNLTPHELIMRELTPQGFSSDSFDKTDTANLMTPIRPLRGRGSRGGRISRSVGRGCRGRGRGRTPATVPRSRPRGIGGLTHTPEKDGGFFTPERRKTDDSKMPKTSSLQLFEEDTRMSAESISIPARQSEGVHNEDTQSSMQSSTSVLDGSSTTIKKQRAKMEVVAPEGKTEYTVDMIAEYDWPPPKGCCPAKNRDTFMIQEQIAQYLGIKSFKRKYPDLPRRQVDMEERNYLREKGLVTEKMCDLGITAVWASDVLDIMYSDFYDKYEEYKNYLRQKQLRDIEAKQKAMAAEAVDKGMQARERALQSAAKWNSNFNKVRKEDRRLCLDLQSLVIQIPSAVGKKMSRPSVTQQPPSNYPVALVPGQFTEYYRTYAPEELRCYPINTVLEEHESLSDRLRPKIEQEESSDSESESSDSSSSGSDTESSSGDSDSNTSSLSDEDEPPDGQLKCFVCHHPQNRNQHGMPEVFIRCVTCRRRTHPSCIEMPRRMVTRVRNYNWQCAECKCCIKCKRKQEDNKMLFCEQCDRGYHIYCLQIKAIPEGRWHCEFCAVCMRCGSRKPEGNLPPPTPPPPPSQDEKKKSHKKKAKWVHEYKIDHLTKIREHFSILCVPCARLKTNRPKS